MTSTHQPLDYPPLSNYRCRAIIDRLTVRLVTRKPTNFDSLQTAWLRIVGGVAKPSIKAVDAGAGGAARVFDVRIQDPPRLDSLIDQFVRLETRFPQSAPPKIVMLEVAVDFYSKSNNRAELLAMVRRLMCGSTNDGAKPRQFVAKMKSGRSRMRMLSNPKDVEFVDPRNTYYAGMKDIDPVTWRIYLKETDNGEAIVDVSQHRARMEVTLLADELGRYVTTLQSLENLRFQSLAGKFSCRSFVPLKVEDGLSPMARLLANRLCKVQAEASRVGQSALWRSRRRKFSEYSRADIELNTMSREALRGLTQRFNTKKRGGIRPKSLVCPMTGLPALLTANTSATSHSSASHPVAPV